MELAQLRLRKNEERRIKGGHLWVFSNEVDNKVTPLKSFSTGQLVSIESSQGKSLGVGYVNPNTLLTARLLNRDPKMTIDRSWFVHRFNIALSLRTRCFDQPYYRLVFGESDGLPGLVVDRFGDHLVLQITTAGMEKLKSDIIDALVKVVKPSSILIRNDSKSRDTEGLSKETEQAIGITPEKIQIIENNTQFLIDPHQGQKTGWFFDHRVSRQQISRYVKGKRVLDVFSYIGAFGLQMATAGASDIWCIDISGKALDELHQNAQLNAVDKQVTCVEGDALTAMKSLRQEAEKFDVIVVDPPAFIKKKKDHSAGLSAYRRINEMAMRLLNKDGILLSASCSMHLKTTELQDCLRGGSRHIEKQLQIIEQCHQGSDHPIHPAINETQYIKGFISRIVSAS